MCNHHEGDWVYPSDEAAKLAILLVEDNPCDVILFRQILRKCSVDCSLTVATDGLKGFDMLRPDGSATLEQQFNAVFLDLDLPGKNGAQLLADMKADSALALIPVAVLTGSDRADDQQVCKALGVDAYFHKASILQDFLALVNDIESFLAKARNRPAQLQQPDETLISAA